jgi:DNA-binding CsgD family transcriptional regulator
MKTPNVQIAANDSGAGTRHDAWAGLQRTMQLIDQCIDEWDYFVGAEGSGASPETDRSMAELGVRLREICERLDSQLRCRLEEGSSELPRQAALRAIGNVRGAVLVVDCERRRVACAGSPDDGSHWRPWKGRAGKSIIAATRRLLEPTAHGTAPARFPVRVGGTVILSVAPFAREYPTSRTRFAALHVARAATRPSAHDTLSPREREIARLLADGYSSVNIAALCGVSTNTVRTLMRRVYGKLGVFNRADLVRQVLRY